MYLKRLDIQGFKSFPDKIKLDFKKGITVVVGPNGSGKSNISDCVRWVLGEMRPKSLRGDKMEDVIFIGTQNRKALGFAEVSITIDNGDRKIPIDYTEVTITRTVYRSGESRYMINGTVCRLKDVHELFMDTGVGKEGYSIIGQGRIDEILSSKGEDRRRIFEDAAGIMKYKNRRQESIMKLDKERQNLVRVEDIISELNLQIEPLANQSEKAKVYLGYKENLKNYEINVFFMQIDKIEEDLQNLEQNLGILNNNKDLEMLNYQKNKEGIIHLKQNLEEISMKIEYINEDIIEIRTQIEKYEGEISLTEERLRNCSQNIARLNYDMETITEKIENLKNESSINESKLNAIELNINSESAKLLEKEEKYNDISNFLTTNEIETEGYKADIIEKMKQNSEMKSNLQRVKATLEQFLYRKEQLIKEEDYSKSQFDEFNIHIKALEKQIKENEEEYIGLNKVVKEIFEDKKNSNLELVALQNIKTATLNELNERKSKYNILAEMEKEHDGFYKSVRSILNLKDKDLSFNGICGAVGEIIKVDKKFETAIEIALGSSLQNIVTENENDAKHAIDFLKKNNLGRATFLPISVIKSRDIEIGKESLLSNNGTIGIAKNLIDYEKKYESVMSSLLGRVIIADNIENAIRIAKNINYKYKIVTLDGDVISYGGVMTGGSSYKKSNNIFARAREIGELKEEIARLNDKSDEILQKVSIMIKKAEEINQLIENKNYLLHEIDIKKVSLSQEIKQFNEKTLQEGNKYKLISIEKKQLEEQILLSNKDIARFDLKIIKLDEEVGEINDRILLFNENMRENKEERDILLNSITSIKMVLSGLEQNKIAVIEDIKRINKELKKLSEDIIKTEEEISALKIQSLDKGKEIIGLRYEIDIKKDKKKELQIKIQELSNDRGKIKLTIDEKEHEQEEKNELIQRLNNRTIRMEGDKEKLQESEQRLIDSMWEEYEITYQMAKEHGNKLEISVVEIMKRIKELKNEIKLLGSVNVNSIEEYKDVKERYEFLTAQRNDIIESEKKLIQIIDELSVLMKEQFKQQFGVISDNFNIVFKEMFGGGKAYLKLADESDILESGIEIIAQPPGKNLQNMMLLSGGERALTAIAILFAILKMKPSPFCILDEIEAALDDANVRRFSNYLKNFSNETQFIVITHRKGTMESADVMYGVTMQEQGVSKIISVKFDKVAGEK